jgi:hypothetical protein
MISQYSFSDSFSQIPCLKNGCGNTISSFFKELPETK